MTGNVHAVLSPVPPSEERTLARLIDMKELEKRAADLVVAELGAVRWKLRDTRKLGVQMRDFDIVCSRTGTRSRSRSQRAPIR